MTSVQPVYLFGTCLIDMYYPTAGLDAAALLELCGYQVEYPLAQTCCGQPAYNSGYTKESYDVAAHTVRLFSQQNYPLIVPSASCASMIKHEYPSLLARQSELSRLANSLAARTFELIDFIADLLPFDQLAKQKEQTVCLHASCSSQRAMPVADRWREVLSSIPGVSLLEPEDAAECCGFGGTFAVKSPVLSNTMTKDKAAKLLAGSPDCIASGDCGCLMSLGNHIKYLHGHDPCLHIASILANAFGVAHEE